MSKLVKAQSKGMVTIPIEYREKLGIEANSILKAELVDNGVVFIKVNHEPEIYSDEQIKEWVEHDKLDEITAKKLEKLLKNG